MKVGDHLNTARFVTFSCYRRHRLLTSPEVIRTFLRTLQSIRVRYAIKLLGYVIMPEHVHLVLHPPDSLKLGPVVGELKSQSASRIVTEELVSLPRDCMVVKNGRERHAFWQPRCYDHNCRNRETVLEKINYCHNNPVVRGLAPEPGQWRWSSYNWYAGVPDVPLVMDAVDDEVTE
jgi:putative transposase